MDRVDGHKSIDRLPAGAPLAARPAGATAQPGDDAAKFGDEAAPGDDAAQPRDEAAPGDDAAPRDGEAAQPGDEAAHDRSGRSPRSAQWLGDFVYGTIGTLAVVEGLTFESRLDGLEAIGAVLVGALAIWLAHGVSRLVTERAGRDTVLRLGDVAGEFGRTWPIVAAALPAALVLVLADHHVWSVSRGLTISEVVGVVALAVAGIGSASGRHRSVLRQVGYVLALTVTGALIVALEVGVHHL